MTSADAYQAEGDLTTPEERLRRKWAGNLVTQFDRIYPDGNRKQFQADLKAVGCEVSMQTISVWLRGEASPRPIHQVAIGAVLRVSAGLLFPVEAA